MPVAFGVLTTNTAEEAMARAGDGAGEQGPRGRARGVRDGAALRATARRERRPAVMSSPRHQAREAALQALYLWEVGRTAPADGARDVLRRARAGRADGRARRSRATLVLGTAADVAALDALITQHSEHWRIERLAVIDRLILRMAAWELQHAADTPPAVVLNEALELARTFSTDDSVRFVNGVLDGIRKTLCYGRSDDRMSNEAEQIAQRQAKLDELVAPGRGGLSEPVRSHRRPSSAIKADARRRRPARRSRPSTSQVRAAGRILGMRAFGKANFLVLSDGLERLQVYVRADSVPELDFQIYQHLDLGDQIGVEGRLFRTKTNELTIWASRIHFLTKCLLPLPEKWHGLTDVEMRYRQRYLDLIVNPDVAAACSRRARASWPAIRRFLNARGFLEVETPMMQPMAGGALARPFTTHHNALDLDLYPAHRARAVSEAADGRRLRARVRDQPQLPERGHLDAAQSRVHDARVLRSVRGLRAPDAADRGDAGRGRARGDRRRSTRRSASTRSRSRRRTGGCRCARAAAEAASATARAAPVTEADLRDRARAAEVAHALGLEVQPSPRRRQDRDDDLRGALGRPSWCSRRSSTTFRRRSRRCPSSGPTIRTRSSASSCTPAGSRSPTASAS